MPLNLKIQYKSKSVQVINVLVESFWTLERVLEEACKKLNLDPKDYLLMHKKKSLDSSLSIRLLDLVQGCTLDLLPINAIIRKSPMSSTSSLTFSTCTIAINLEKPKANERLVASFTTDTSLWNVLDATIGSDSIKLDGNSILVPEVRYIDRKISEIKELMTVNLYDLGIKNDGNYLLNVSLRSKKTMSLIEFENIMQSNSKAFSKSPSSRECNETLSLSSPSLNEGAFHKNSLSSSIQPLPKINNEKNILPSLNHSSQCMTREMNTESSLSNVEFVLEPKDITTYTSNVTDPSQIASFPDEFYEFNSGDLGEYQKSLEQRTKTLYDKPLVSHKQLVDQENERIRNQYPLTRIRFKFPNRTVIEATFSTLEHVSNLYSFIDSRLSSTLQDEEREREEKIKSYTINFGIPPKLIDRNDQNTLLLEMKLYPASILNVFWTENDKNGIFNILDASTISNQKGNEETKNRPSNNTNHESSIPLTNSNKNKNKSFGIPKWFKGLGEKG